MSERHDNPYRASGADPRPRRPPSWPGIAVIALAVLIYGPMTVTPFAMAVLEPAEERWVRLGAGVFNGCIFALLLWLGYWLVKRAYGPKR